MPQIIDGYCGEPHVEAEEIWKANVAICGPGLWRADTGGQCDVTLANNNTVTVANGIIIADGIRAIVPAPESISIANGVVGMNRIDLIVFRYTKDASTSIMQTEWKVIQGQSTTGTPEEPAYTPGDVLDGATVAEWAYASVELNGLTVLQPEIKAKLLKSYTSLWDSLSQDVEHQVEKNSPSVSSGLSNVEIGYNGTYSMFYIRYKVPGQNGTRLLKFDNIGITHVNEATGATFWSK